MSDIKAYSDSALSWRMHFLTRISMILSFLVIVLTPELLFGQEEYDEISVFLEVPQVGVGEITSVIHGNELFLPVTDLFDFLKIRNVPGPES